MMISKKLYGLYAFPHELKSRNNFKVEYLLERERGTSAHRGDASA